MQSFSLSGMIVMPYYSIYTYNIMKSIIFLSLILILAVTIPPALAEDDDDKYEERDHDEEREGVFEEMQEKISGESEDGERHDDDRANVGGFSGVILYGTIIAIVATIGYTAFKILKKKK
jgi:hypothetical protein